MENLELLKEANKTIEELHKKIEKLEIENEALRASLNKKKRGNNEI